MGKKIWELIKKNNIFKICILIAFCLIGAIFQTTTFGIYIFLFGVGGLFIYALVFIGFAIYNTWKDIISKT